MEQEYRGKYNKIHVAIVGAGASGCMCAYFLSKEGIDVTLFDKASPLRTLLPTGGGRCNLAHAEYDFKELAKNYPRGEKFLFSLFSRFATAETIATFEEMGINTYTQDDNRIFPESNSAKEVRETLLNELTGVKFIKKEIKSLKELDFTHIVIATGGHSGYELLKELDINIIEPKPSLVGLNTKEKFNDISGTVCKGVVANGLNGDVLFTHFGLSGPLIYKISSIKAFDSFPYELELDLAPNLEDLQSILNIYPHKEIKNILKEHLPHQVVSKILVGIDETTKAHQINGKTRDLILEKIHHFKVTVTGTNKGEETVTAGGVDLNEINPKTMEVKKFPNLFCIGEVLNIDGFCGGFNLQNAWTTAFVAAEKIKQ